MSSAGISTSLSKSSERRITNAIDACNIAASPRSLKLRSELDGLGLLVRQGDELRTILAEDDVRPVTLFDGQEAFVQVFVVSQDWPPETRCLDPFVMLEPSLSQVLLVELFFKTIRCGAC